MSILSLIIPVFNEEKIIKKSIHTLLDKCHAINNIEMIIVDGGSTDNSIHQIPNHPKIKIISSKKGRAKQMNAGANIAKGSVLYFLHIDSTPPDKYDLLIHKKIKNNNLAGCFKMKFDDSHPWLNFVSWFTQFNFRSCRGGDQSLFVTKKLFLKLGGYNEKYIIFEDNNFISKLYKINEFTVIQQSIITSARKYKEIGVFKLQFHFLMIYFYNFIGKSPKFLYEYYRRTVINNK